MTTAGTRWPALWAAIQAQAHELGLPAESAELTWVAADTCNVTLGERRGVLRLQGNTATWLWPLSQSGIYMRKGGRHWAKYTG